MKCDRKKEIIAKAQSYVKITRELGELKDKLNLYTFDSVVQKDIKEGIYRKEIEINQLLKEINLSETLEVIDDLKEELEDAFVLMP